MKENGIIRAIRLKLVGGGHCVRVGSNLLEDVVRTINRQKAEIRNLKDALDAGNRELAQVKAENERLNRENLWLTGGIEKR